MFVDVLPLALAAALSLSCFGQTIFLPDAKRYARDHRNSSLECPRFSFLLHREPLNCSNTIRVRSLCCCRGGVSRNHLHQEPVTTFTTRATNLLISLIAPLRYQTLNDIPKTFTISKIHSSFSPRFLRTNSRLTNIEYRIDTRSSSLSLYQYYSFKQSWRDQKLPNLPFP